MIAMAACGGLVAVLGIPMMKRRVRPNGLYGLRTPATFADESVWYDANAQSGKDIAILGIFQLILALALPLAGLSTTSVALAWSAAFVVGALVMATVGWRRADRLLRERQAS
ncbi:MAG: SdpI family protein [Acidobacteriota bacterium]